MKSRIPYLLVALLIIFITLTACKSSKEFKFGYRVCALKSNDCGEHDILFKSLDACHRYLEKSGFRCFGGEYLDPIQDGAPVCWKSKPTIARGECNEI